MQEKKPISGYNGWALPEKDRESLLEIIPPLFPDVLAHHITDRSGAKQDDALPTATEALVVGVANNDHVQALVVQIDGSTERKDGNTYHITWSIDRAAGAKPFDSVALLKTGYDKLPGAVRAIPISIDPAFFPQNPPTLRPAPEPALESEPSEADEPFSESAVFESLLGTIKLNT